MATTKKTPAQVRDAKLAKLNKAVQAKQITAAEYRQGVNAAKAAYETSKRGGSAAAGRAVSAAGMRAEQGAAALRTAAGMKAPVSALARGARFIAGVPKSLPQAAVQAAIVAGPWAFDKLQGIGQGMQKQAASAKVPTSSVDKAATAVGKRLGSVAPKTATAPRTATNKPSGSQATQRSTNGLRGASTAPKTAKTKFSLVTAKPTASGRTGAPGALAAKKKAATNTYTVKAGDNLSKIAAQNNTTVSALLKANPTIAARRQAGKVDIFSGSKVRIPGKK